MARRAWATWLVTVALILGGLALAPAASAADSDLPDKPVWDPVNTGWSGYPSFLVGTGTVDQTMPFDFTDPGYVLKTSGSVSWRVYQVKVTERRSLVEVDGGGSFSVQFSVYCIETVSGNVIPHENNGNNVWYGTARTGNDYVDVFDLSVCSPGSNLDHIIARHVQSGASVKWDAGASNDVTCTDPEGLPILCPKRPGTPRPPGTPTKYKDPWVAPESRTPPTSSDRCAGAPAPSWGDFTWLGSTIDHYNDCLFVPQNSWDADGIYDALDGTAYGDVSGFVDGLAGVQLQGGCGVIVDQPVNILGGQRITLTTCGSPWDQAGPIRDLFGWAFIAGTVILCIIIVTRALGLRAFAVTKTGGDD